MQNVTFSWEGDSAGVYDFQYREKGTIEWIELASSPALGTSVNISNLEDETDYEFRVRAHGQTDVSAWQYYSYKTAAGGCVAPTSVSVSGISQNAVNVSWNSAPSAVNGYIVQWKKASQLSWLTSQVIHATVFTVTGLTSGTDYQVKILSICTDGGTADSAGVNFKTVSTTNLCTGLSVSGISVSSSGTAYTAVWSNVGGNPISHKVEYSLNGTNWFVITPSSQSLTSATYTIAGLTFPSNHQIRITPKCGDNSLGTSAVYSFTAPADPAQFVTFKNFTGGIITWIGIDGSPNILTSDLAPGGTKKYNQTGLLGSVHNAQATLTGIANGATLTVSQIRGGNPISSGSVIYNGVAIPLAINQNFTDQDIFQVQG